MLLLVGSVHPYTVLIAIYINNIIIDIVIMTSINFLRSWCSLLFLWLPKVMVVVNTINLEHAL